MATLDIENIPEFRGTDVLSAKQWFSALSDKGLKGFHADDPLEGGELLTDVAAEKLNEIMSELRGAARSWPDPDFIYDLAGEGGHFQIEKDYPGFIVDRSVPAASRTGYVSVPGMEVPTLVCEEYNAFVLMQFVPGTGKLSETATIRVVPTEGVKFSGPDKVPYIDVRDMKTRDEEAREVVDFDELEDVLVEVTRPVDAPKI